VGLANIQFHAELIDKRVPCTAIAHLCINQKAALSVVLFLQGHFTNFGRIMSVGVWKKAPINKNTCGGAASSKSALAASAALIKCERAKKCGRKLS
jgi:hypothetical protein